MLIRFSIENFSSFNSRQSFSMLPNMQRIKPEHKTEPIDGISVLKTSVLFGANASGKSNLVKAIRFGQDFLLNGMEIDKGIDYPKFRLDKKTEERDSRIEYEIQHKGKNYAYGFVFNNFQVKEEWLYRINKKKDIKIFERNSNNEKEFDLESLTKNISIKEEKQFLEFVAKGTPRNRLFLTEIRFRRVKENVSNIDDLLNVLDWFQNVLTVILPEDKYNMGLRVGIRFESDIKELFETYLKYFDTGIDGVCFEKVDADSLNIPTKVLSKIKEDLISRQSDKRASFLSSNHESFYITLDEKNELFIEKLMTKHKIKDGGFAKFDISDESDGTNRVMDFIPLLHDLHIGNKVFIIDEMERSLHPNLVYDILDMFLNNAEERNSQLVLASHESSLLTQKLLRRDEIWFVVKSKEGESQLYSLEEYDIRFDKKVRKDYLLGRFKAVPQLGDRASLLEI